MSVHEFLCHLWYSWTLHCWWFELMGLNHLNQVCDQQCPNPRHVQSSLLGPPQQSTALHPPPLHRSYPSTQDPLRMPLPIGLPGCVLPSHPPVSPPNFHGPSYIQLQMPLKLSCWLTKFSSIHFSMCT